MNAVGASPAELRRLAVQIGLDAVRANEAGLVPDSTVVAELYDAWADYIATVSAADMAVSLETAALLLHLCRTRQPDTVLDLGSGFSSYVLRIYAAESGASVTSVDTDRDWLDRTAKFIADRGLPTVGLVMLDDWDRARYGLVFHDIGSGDLRNEMAAVAADLGDIVVFDDAQHGGHCFLAYRTCVSRFDVFNVACCTHDDTGRFALVAVRTTSPTPSLTEQFVAAALTPSDINEHLPRMVRLVDELDAQHVIELGSRSGVSTAGWLYGLAGTGGRLTSVDLDTAPPIGAWPHWEHVVGDDCDPEVTARLEPADIVFIDTSHVYEHTQRELAVYRWLVKPGGVIVCHDTELAWPEGTGPPEPVFPVKRAIREFCADNGFEWANFPECYGLGVIKVR